MKHGFDDPQRRFGGGRTVWIAHLQSCEQTQPARRKRNGKRSRAQRQQILQERPPELRAALDEFQPRDFPDLRQGHRAADGMTEERAGVDRFTC
jgi:hypothetical protein